MQISDVINKLVELKERYGNLECYYTYSQDEDANVPQIIIEEIYEVDGFKFSDYADYCDAKCTNYDCDNSSPCEKLKNPQTKGVCFTEDFSMYNFSDTFKNKDDTEVFTTTSTMDFNPLSRQELEKVKAELGEACKHMIICENCEHFGKPVKRHLLAFKPYNSFYCDALSLFISNKLKPQGCALFHKKRS